MGYSLCKNVSLGQKLNCSKTCEKRREGHNRNVPRRNRPQKRLIFEK